MADFTSALYLGLRHPGAALGDWDALTLGKPAALQEPPGGVALAAGLAALQGCQAASLLPSTLHLFWDLFGLLAQERLALLVDAGAYPIARWGAERAAALGLPMQLFGRGDAPAAGRLARRWRDAGRRPLILADGYCPGAERAPPLAQYAAIASAGGGYLVLDDTQVLGLLGPGGGGSVPLHRLAGPGVVVGASLAKGFGAPLAVLAGSAALLRRFEAHSGTRVHTSPPSTAAIRAGARALRLNRQCGDALRALLRQRVAQWRGALARLGVASRGGAFPVQSVPLERAVDAAALHAGLRRSGVDSVLGSGALTFLLRADHTPADIDGAVAALQYHLLEAT
ncbi:MULTISPECIES: hypothetical protein [unclassified Janthinobacterium]|uniref:hypothetical protein n=1 Tax=unclassified Janthinobacterium TaxID=2610881 RepID=UPI000346B0AB|nr:MULTISPECIES: hypothetical protein [unclassified Janthinobacterium]MEC5161058.1 8-amino-7-oxononanoate synthase [Janthinobacterium sp. CG_S6]